MQTTHCTLHARMHEVEYTTSIEDNFSHTIVAIDTYKKCDYKVYKDACVVSFTYLWKSLQDATNQLYVFKICLTSNE
jgi:hypothetical protein